MVNTRKIAEKYQLTHWAQVLQDRTQSVLQTVWDLWEHVFLLATARACGGSH